MRTGKQTGSRLQKIAYGFYLVWGGAVLLVVALMLEGSVLGYLLARDWMPSFLVGAAIPVVVMWCVATAASFVSKDPWLVFLSGATVILAFVVSFLPFWAPLVYGVACCTVATRWFSAVQDRQTLHATWS